MSQIKGHVHKLLPKEMAGKFEKRILVINTGGEYPENVPIEFLGNKVGVLDGIEEGDAVTVYYGLRGREWQGRWFASIRGWKVEVTNSAGRRKPDEGYKNPHYSADTENGIGDDDDIPF